MIVSKISRFSVGNYLLKLRHSHSAVAKSDTETGLLPKQDKKITKNVTGVTIASLENYSPVTQVSVLVKAGPRYESPDQHGISHALRTSTVLSTKNNSAFLLTRQLELVGAKLKVTSTREYLMYTLVCPRDSTETGIKLLADVTTQHLFKPWEVESVLPKLKIELAMLEKNPEAGLMEVLNRAAFRGGLSNSLYIQPHNIGKYNSDMLHDFVTKNFTSPRVFVAGLGIDHELLENSVTQNFEIDRIAPGSAGESRFIGGELRVEADIPYAQAAIVAEGAGIKNFKDSLSLGLFQCILGTGLHHRHSSPEFSKLGEAAKGCTSHPYSVSSLNISYSDLGLFGVHVAGHPNDMSQLVKSIISYMRGATKNLTEENLKIAKNKLKAKVAFERESPNDLLQDMVIQTASIGQIHDYKDIEKTIEGITLSDVSSIACKVMKAKPAMAALGPLHNTPHIDELL